MQSRFRRTGALVGAGAVLFGALAVALGNQAGAEQTPPLAPLDQLLGEQSVQGRTALAKLQPRLAELADRNGIAAEQLERILATDKTSWLDEDGKLFYREPVATKAEQAETVASPKWATAAVTAAVGPAFELHSKKGSNRVIYLDFDGHTVTGTAWNSDGKPASVKVPAYDT